MDHQVVLFCGQKGGVGKSTLTTNIATLGAASGLDVMVIDGDKQLSSKRFLDFRRDHHPELPLPMCSITDGSGAGRLIDSLNERYGLIVVDLSGGDSSTLRSALNADSIQDVWLPVQPSGLDVQTVPFMSALVDEYSRVSRPLSAKVIMTRVETNKRVGAIDGSLEYLSQLSGVTVARSMIYERVAFKHAAVNGVSAAEYQAMQQQGQRVFMRKEPKAGNEAISLFLEITSGHSGVSREKLALYLDEIASRDPLIKGDQNGSN